MASHPTTPQPSLAALSREECLQLLSQHGVGRLAVVLDGRPHIMPLNYAADENGVIVFRTADLTVANEAALAHVAFEIDEIDSTRREGWSVAVHGLGHEIGDAIDRESERLRRLPVHPWAPGQRDRWYKITSIDITGRRLSIAPSPS